MTWTWRRLQQRQSQLRPQQEQPKSQMMSACDFALPPRVEDPSFRAQSGLLEPWRVVIQFVPSRPYDAPHQALLAVQPLFDERLLALPHHLFLCVFVQDAGTLPICRPYDAPRDPSLLFHERVDSLLVSSLLPSDHGNDRAGPCRLVPYSSRTERMKAATDLVLMLDDVQRLSRKSGA